MAARILRDGGLVAFPTETVYGLGADVFNPSAVGKIFTAKGRPADNPLIVHISSRSQLDRVAASIPEHANRLMDAFWPGPLTVILPRHPAVPYAVTAGLETVGVRFPSHPQALAFLRAARTPVAAPSANRSGRPSPTTWQAVREDLDGRVDCILKGAPSQVGLESTVVDCTGRRPVVLRSGAIPVESLRSVVPHIRLANARDKARGRSPGLKHRHYAPSIPVRIRTRIPKQLSDSEAWIGIGSPPKGGRLVKGCRDIDDYARHVFEFFRASERAGAKVIYCQAVSSRGIGRALMDRIRRAARNGMLYESCRAH
ncbi:MAG: L-threonylcarbamoyladenylate synthase [Kiritimatiellae bacterium]|nr:L-threonylcarbamoyladenylate synthase [Kiritimatiellia bacterium]MDW8459343.1 L-threonylcarbamoyladenylate synthase [Verrucomicrobiota bacterium]